MAQNRQIFAQLSIGKQELSRFSERDILRRITDANTRANLGAILLRPSKEKGINNAVLDHCRTLGLETYLWFPVLANAYRKPNADELIENAWGGRGHGQSGLWKGIDQGEESFLFACPRSPSYINDIENDCRRQLEQYDGLFLDRLRYPSPANGIETLFSCFCPRCLEHNPEASYWRENAKHFRRFIEKAPHDTLPYWPEFINLLKQHGFDDFLQERKHNLMDLARRFTRLAVSHNKKIAFDLITPTLSIFVGQDYQSLGELADWLKPVIYCRAHEPTSLSLELASLVRGFSQWSDYRFMEKTVLSYYRESLNMPEIPTSLEELEKNGLAISAAQREYTLSKQTRMTFPGFESMCHPEYDLKMTQDDIAKYVDAFADASTLIPSWNILYIPDSYLEFMAPREMPSNNNNNNCAS